MKQGGRKDMTRTRRIEIRVNDDEISCIEVLCSELGHRNISDMFLNALVYYVRENTDKDISNIFHDKRKLSSIKKGVK